MLSVTTNPGGPLKSMILAFRFLGENRRIPYIFAQESESEFERAVRVGGTLAWSQSVKELVYLTVY